MEESKNTITNKKRIQWTKEEEDLISKLVEQKGCKKWLFISKTISQLFNKHRTPRQCRDRWVSVINPNISKIPLTWREKKLICQLHHIYGNKWVKISKFLRGKTENTVKNWFYNKIRKIIKSPKIFPKNISITMYFGDIIEELIRSQEIYKYGACNITLEELQKYLDSLRDIWVRKGGNLNNIEIKIDKDMLEDLYNLNEDRLSGIRLNIQENENKGSNKRLTWGETENVEVVVDKLSDLK